jgi:hypothetical protein
MTITDFHTPNHCTKSSKSISTSFLCKFFTRLCLVTNLRWLTLHSWTSELPSEFTYEWMTTILLQIWIPNSDSLIFLAESESYVTTDGQSASLSSSKVSFRGYDQIFITVRELRVCSCGCSLWREDGSVISSHFRVRVPWDSRPYFTVSDSR